MAPRWLLLCLLPGCVFDTTGLHPPARDTTGVERSSGERRTNERLPADRKAELSCPSGFVPCAGLCVDTAIHPDHCGGCNRPCAAGLDCEAAVCKCVGGGRCAGCCAANACRAFAVATCGKNGAACTSCDDKNPCTTDSCSAGDCVHVALSGGSCDDGLFCTVSDVCASGVCAGAARNCSALGDSCNDGICSETAGQCVRKPKTNGTPCGQGHFCWNGHCVEPPEP